MQLAEIQALVDQELKRIDDTTLVEALASRRVVPVARELTFQLDPKKRRRSFIAWHVIEADNDRRIMIAFADGGHGDYGYPWGLVDLENRDAGSSNSWYGSLEDCARDSGYFE